MRNRDLARGLAWFGIGLGAMEVIAPGAVARAAGGGRFARPERWLWVRVAGDLPDSAVLSAGVRAGGARGMRATLATAAVLPVLVLDVVYAIRAWRRREPAVG